MEILKENIATYCVIEKKIKRNQPSTMLHPKP
jgi:hypothetical protein